MLFFFSINKAKRHIGYDTYQGEFYDVINNMTWAEYCSVELYMYGT